jgi:LPS-assembly protein
MRSVATLLLLLQLALYAADDVKKSTRYTLYASTIETEDDRVFARGDIMIYAEDMMFSADNAVYDRKKELLTLSGNVTLFYQGNMISKAKKLRFQLDKDKFSASKVFIQEVGSDIWIKSKFFKADKNNLIIKKAVLSSCLPDDPDWEIRFSTAHFHKDKEYVSLYNPRFYLGKIPVLYLPWFAFPTIKERRTGLLRPVIGFENSENLLFMQPIFIAPSKSWDIQLDPQIRLNRGSGLYATLRFADTPYSKGSLTVGLFDEKKGYAKDHNLKNKVHRGASFSYVNQALFTKYIQKNPYDYKDGLYVDLTALNDIDYINLKDDRKYAVDKLVTSRINYYMSGYGDYIGAYAKYFIDTEKVSNDDTLQTLPSLQYHKFSQILGIDNLIYSIDYKFKNSYRKEGLGARQHEISVPLVFTMPLLENYLNFSASENFYYSRVYYTDANESVSNARYLSNYHRLSIESDLMKQYPDTVHNLQLSLAFTIPSLHNRSGYFADFIPFNLQRKNIAFKMNNYLYDNNGHNYLIDRFTQHYYYDEQDKRYNEAENEVIYTYSPNLTLRNALIYSYEYHKLKKIQSGIYYHDDLNKLRLDHTYKNAPNETKINFISADFSRVIDRRYSVTGGLDYDFDNSFTKEWRLGLLMHKKCWSYELRYKESITPSLTSGGTESITRRGIYLLMRFAHIGGVEYKYIKDIESSNLHEDTIEEIIPTGYPEISPSDEKTMPSNEETTKQVPNEQ